MIPLSGRNTGADSNSILSFRRSLATEKSKRVQRFLLTMFVEMTVLRQPLLSFVNLYCFGEFEFLCSSTNPTLDSSSAKADSE